MSIDRTFCQQISLRPNEKTAIRRVYRFAKVLRDPTYDTLPGEPVEMDGGITVDSDEDAVFVFAGADGYVGDRSLRSGYLPRRSVTVRRPGRAAATAGNA